MLLSKAVTVTVTVQSCNCQNRHSTSRTCTCPPSTKVAADCNAWQKQSYPIHRAEKERPAPHCTHYGTGHRVRETLAATVASARRTMRAVVEFSSTSRVCDQRVHTYSYIHTTSKRPDQGADTTRPTGHRPNPLGMRPTRPAGYDATTLRSLSPSAPQTLSPRTGTHGAPTHTRRTRTRTRTLNPSSHPPPATHAPRHHAATSSYQRTLRPTATARRRECPPLSRPLGHEACTRPRPSSPGAHAARG